MLDKSPGPRIHGLEIQPFRDMDEALASFIGTDGAVAPGFAIAVGTEKLVQSFQDQRIHQLLREGTLLYADSVGVVWAMHRKGFHQVARIPGCELWERLMEYAGKHGIPVFLVGSTEEVVTEVVRRVNQQWNVHVVGYSDGYFKDPKRILAQIQDSSARIVSVAMGSPIQEIMISKWRKHYPDALYLGVGGTFDVYAGKVRRAPAWVRRINLEFLYRLLAQPSRIGRYIAIPKFIRFVLQGKIDP